MPRFLFDMNDGSATQAEEIDLADLAAAREMALGYVGQTLPDDGADFWRRGELRLDVRSGEGLHLFSVWVLSTDAPALHITLVNPTD